MMGAGLRTSEAQRDLETVSDSPPERGPLEVSRESRRRGDDDEPPRVPRAQDLCDRLVRERLGRGLHVLTPEVDRAHLDAWKAREPLGGRCAGADQARLFDDIGLMDPGG